MLVETEGEENKRGFAKVFGTLHSRVNINIILSSVPFLDVAKKAIQGDRETRKHPCQYNQPNKAAPQGLRSEPKLSLW